MDYIDPQLILITHNRSDARSGQAYLDCYYPETNGLFFYTAKWDDISLKLFLEYNQADSLARERAMYTTIGRRVSPEQLNAELQEIRKIADETMDTIWKILSAREVHIYVEVQQPSGEKKNMVMPVCEFDGFCKNLSDATEPVWWPTHFKTFREASEYVTTNLSKK